MTLCKSFAPVADEHSKILILGSMPGKKSLEMQQYYAYPQNRFWKLVAYLLKSAAPVDYAEKIALLKRSNIALWDVLAYCEREGSLDSDIKNEVPNDIAGLLQVYPQIKAVFCNGGKAGTAFKKYFAQKLPKDLPVYYLHSTSPANARMRLEDLAEEWQVILKYL